MKRQLTNQWKKLLAELDLAQQAFNASHARLSQSLRAAEAGKQPAHPLQQSLHQHLTATSCLLAMGRAMVSFRKQYFAAPKAGPKRRRGNMLSAA